VKLSHDPNNTKWTNNTEGFGHKMMISQGWEPGQYLGAKDAKHAEFHTAANASHIRVQIKDDNLGLGAKIGSGVGHGECTGLDAFKNLLGRLNGKDEDELAKEQQSRDDLKRAIYTERRWGSIRFVPGGFLIGDKIQHLIDGEAERIRKLALGESPDSASDSSDSSSDSEEEAPAPVEKPKKSKKRKMADVEAEDAKVVVVKVKKSKKKEISEETLDNEAETEAALKAEKAARKKAKKERKAKEVAEDTPEDVEVEDRKKEKRKKKDRKEKKKKSSLSQDPEEKESRKKKKSRKDKDEGSTESSERSQATTKESTPATPITIDTSGRSTPLMGGRHAVRARNIAQKRMASMDVASLNQVSSYQTHVRLPHANRW
jgi:Pin2-interacting protein X1